MKRLHLLYIYSGEAESSILQVLSSRYSVQMYRAGKGYMPKEENWDLVVFQDSVLERLHKKIRHTLEKYPGLFISTSSSIEGYIAPLSNLFGAINLSNAALALFGIPEEMQLRIPKPAEKTTDCYFYEPQPEICRIVYCPTGNNIVENDFKLISFVQKSNAVLTIVSDRYMALANAFPSFVHVVPDKFWLAVFKKAHLVVASGYNVVCALALCKPCIILGDCGLGGMVTIANYEQLQSVFFSGRKGASPDEIVPADLLDVEICKVFLENYQETTRFIQKKVLQTYGIDRFSEQLTEEIERIIDLSVTMKNRTKRLALKPFWSSVFRIEEVENKEYMMRGMQCFGEIEKEMSDLLKQCNGSLSIQALIEQNNFEPDEASMLWENLYELWKEKLILFKL